MVARAGKCSEGSRYVGVALFGRELISATIVAIVNVIVARLVPLGSGESVGVPLVVGLT